MCTCWLPFTLKVEYNCLSNECSMGLVTYLNNRWWWFDVLGCPRSNHMIPETSSLCLWKAYSSVLPLWDSSTMLSEAHAACWRHMPRSLIRNSTTLPANSCHGLWVSWTFRRLQLPLLFDKACEKSRSRTANLSQGQFREPWKISWCFKPQSFEVVMQFQLCSFWD